MLTNKQGFERFTIEEAAGGIIGFFGGLAMEWLVDAEIAGDSLSTDFLGVFAVAGTLAGAAAVSFFRRRSHRNAIDSANLEAESIEQEELPTPPMDSRVEKGIRRAEIYANNARRRPQP